MGRKTVEKDFYKQDAIQVARDLLGKTLCCRQDSGKVEEWIVTETEAYMTNDPMCYGVRYGENENTKVSFRCGGFAFIYAGMFMVTTGDKNGDPQNVLIRAVSKPDCNGPVKLMDKLQINKDKFNGIELTESNCLWFCNCDTDNVIESDIIPQKRGEFNHENLVKDYMKKMKAEKDIVEAFIKEYMEKEWRFTLRLHK